MQINTSGVPHFLQRGAIAALEKGDGFIAEMVERCRAGGEQVFQRLSANPRITIARPEAAFYAFFSVDGVDDTMAFCKKPGEGLQGRPGAGRGVRSGRAGQCAPLLRLRCRATEQRASTASKRRIKAL